MLKTIFGYKNTSSSAGNGIHHEINTDNVLRAYVWFSSLGNPSYGFHMVNGDTYLLIDDYGAMNGLSRLSRIEVSRKKHLI